MIRLSETRVFAGINPYAPRSVVRLSLDFGELANAPASKLKKDFRKDVPGLLKAAFDRFVTSDEASIGDELLGLRNLKLRLPELLLEIIVCLHEIVRSEPYAGHVIDEGEAGLRHIAVLFEDRRVTQRAGELALRILNAYLPEKSGSVAPGAEQFDIESAIQDFVHFGNEVLNREYGLVRRAARRCNIPCTIAFGANTVLGVGKYRKRNLVSVTENVTKLGHDLVHNKVRANAWLRWNGFPVTRQELVKDAEDAVRAAEAIGYPVCVKPQFGGEGKSVNTGLKTASQVREAYRITKNKFRHIIVENFFEGDDHRLLVSGGELFAAVKKVLPNIVGDGRSSIEELVRKLNSDPRRDDARLIRITIDDELEFLMRRAGYTLKTILPQGEIFTLRMASNWARGSTITDVLDIVHPETRRLASRINKCVGVDPLGIDYITTDISRPNSEVGGAILDLNQMPGLRLHTLIGQDAPSMVVRSVFPEGVPSRGPVALVLGASKTRTAALVLNHLLSMAGFMAGSIFKDTYFVGGERVQQVPSDNHGIIRNIVVDERVESLVHEIDPAKLVSIGAGHSWMDVAIVTDLFNQDEPGNIALSRCVHSAAKASTKYIVLDGDCPTARAMASSIDPDRVCYVLQSEKISEDPASDASEAGAKVVITQSPESGQLVFKRDSECLVLAELDEIPSLHDEKDSAILKAIAMGAAAAAGLGVALEDLQFGLKKLSAGLLADPMALYAIAGSRCRTLIALTPDKPTALRCITELTAARRRPRCVLFVAITNQLWPFAAKRGAFDVPLDQAIADYVGNTGSIVIAEPGQCLDRFASVMKTLDPEDELTILTDNPEPFRKITESHKTL